MLQRLSTDDIKTRIQKMLNERDQLAEHSKHIQPSLIWEEALKYHEYVRELTDKHLDLIQIHSSSINGWLWSKYQHASWRKTMRKEEIENLKEIRLYRKFIRDIPKHYWISEPTFDSRLKILGIPYGGKIINFDTVRYQTCITNLYHAGILDYLRSQKKRSSIMEIGGGGGGLSLQLKTLIGKNCCYIDVDIPELLFYAAIFLQKNAPSSQIYLYDPNTFEPTSLENIIETYDYVLLPNYIIDSFVNVKPFDLMLNLFSFQEMTDHQIQAYVSLANNKLDGWLYSSNWSGHRANSELKFRVEEILAQHLELLTHYDKQTLEKLPMLDTILINHLATSRNRMRRAPNRGIKPMRGEHYEIWYK